MLKKIGCLGLPCVVAVCLILVWPVWAQEPAPNLELTTLKGERLTLAGLKGKVVVLNFFATWCGPCRMEMPELVKLQKELGGKGLQILGLAFSPKVMELKPKEVRKFIADFGLNYPVAIYGQKEIEAYGGVRAVPTTLFVDRQGRWAGGVQGLVSRKALMEKLSALLDG
ncbi:MAG: TlpA family protein disulfide reductase [Deltaproteobacteria bacterium]|nr:TlpA family protein disulfide reductase [Deltaproteobacteria bacterium]